MLQKCCIESVALKNTVVKVRKFEVGLLKYVIQGGPVMWVLLVFSIVGLAVALLKCFQFFRSPIRKVDFVDAVFTKLRERKVAEAYSILKDVKNPIARVMECTINCCHKNCLKEDCLKSEIHRVGSREIRELESGLKLLSSIAHLSPLLGLLGTVLGMITAFMTLEGATTQISPALLAGGIWEALLTTAFGLAIAIPAMGIYTFLEGEVDRVKASMEDAATRILVHFNFEEPDHQSDYGSLQVVRDQSFPEYSA